MIKKTTTTITKIQCAVSPQDYITIGGIKSNYATIVIAALGVTTHIVLDENRAQILIDTLKEHFDL